MTRSVLPGLLALALAGVGCGGSAPPSQSADPPATDPPSDAPPETPPDAPAEEDAEAASEGEGEPEDGGEGASGDEPDPAADPNRQREVLYKMTPNGLVVEVEGASFLVTAKAVRKGNQGWGVRVEVEASAIDGESHRLLSPKSGPLAFAVERSKGGNIKKSGDSRDGDDERLITPGDKLTFSRDWPAKGKRGAAFGEAIKIQAGLWGLAKEGGRRRPVRKFAIVQMVVRQGKPKVFVNPPD